MSLFPLTSSLEFYRCPTCGHVPMALNTPSDSPSVTLRIPANSQIYCPNCGKIYRLLKCGAIDFLGARFNPWQLTPAQAIAHNPPFAWSYERLWRTHALSLLSGESFPPEREASLLRSLVNPAGPILDLAAASGLWSRWLLEQAPESTIFALEHSAPLLEEAAERALPTWPNYSIVRAQAENLPFADRVFSTVMSGGSLNELPLEETVSEIARVLKPGGTFVSMHIQVVSGWGSPLQQAIALSGMNFYSEAYMRQILSSAGLTVSRYLAFGAIVFLTATL